MHFVFNKQANIYQNLHGDTEIWIQFPTVHIWYKCGILGNLIEFVVDVACTIDNRIVKGLPGMKGVRGMPGPMGYDGTYGMKGMKLSVIHTQIAT